MGWWEGNDIQIQPLRVKPLRSEVILSEQETLTDHSLQFSEITVDVSCLKFFVLVIIETMGPWPLAERDESWLLIFQANNCCRLKWKLADLISSSHLDSVDNAVGGLILNQKPWEDLEQAPEGYITYYYYLLTVQAMQRFRIPIDVQISRQHSSLFLPLDPTNF